MTNGWQFVGDKDFDAGSERTSFAFNPATNEPYVAYDDSSCDYLPISVKKYDGTSWSYVGSPCFDVNSSEAMYMSMVFDPSTNTPYIAYLSASDHPGIFVKKLSGSSWVDVGSMSNFDNNMWLFDLAINPSDHTPYVLTESQDDSNNFHIKVKRFNNSSWVDVGDLTDLTSDLLYDSIALAFNPSTNEPYIALEDYNGDTSGISVRKFEDSSWSLVGLKDEIAGSVSEASLGKLLFNTSDNQPYVVTCASNGSRAVTFNGSSWANVASADGIYYAGGPYGCYVSAAFNPSTHDLYVAYWDNDNNGVTVKRTDGSSWDLVGAAGFTGTADRYPFVLAFNPATSGPYVSFSDGVMSYGPVSPPAVPTGLDVY